MRLDYLNNAPQLGLVASHKRKIYTGHAFDKYYPPATELQKTDPILLNGTVYDTLDIIEQYATKYASDTKKITQYLLKGRNPKTQLKAILKDVWEHVYSTFQYKLDKQGVEQVRRPARSYHDRKEGIDCDCMSVLFSSILNNLGIPHYLRMTAYGNDWQHVYVIVPKSQYASMEIRNNYYVLDAVKDQFNSEEPFTKKHDKKMKMLIQGLNGIGGLGCPCDTPAPNFSGYDSYQLKKSISGLGNTLNPMATAMGAEFQLLNGLGNSNSAELDYQMYLESMKKYLQNTRNIIANDPNSYNNAIVISEGVSVPEFINQLDTLLNAWDNDVERTALLEAVIADENVALSGLFKKVGNFISNTAKNVVSTAKNVVNKVTTTVKNVAQNVCQYNPLNLTIRAGVLAAMKSNLFRIAERLGYGYLSTSELSKYNVSASGYSKVKSRLEKVKGIWNALNCGNETKDHLQEAIKQGWGKGRANNKNDHGLGEVVTGAVASTAAAPTLTAIWNIVKDIDWADIIKAVQSQNKSSASTPQQQTPDTGAMAVDSSGSLVDLQQPNQAGTSNTAIIAIGLLAASAGAYYFITNKKKGASATKNKPVSTTNSKTKS